MDAYTVAKLTRPEFEKKLVTEQLVPSRRKAKAVASYIVSNLQGRSAEAHYALVPGIMNAALAPAFSSAKTIVVIAYQRWTGA